MHQLKCQCGAVQGRVLDGAPDNRVRCYCSDCRAFGRFFSPAAEVLDAQGGTEIVQICQSRLRFDRGLEHLAAIRLSEKGMIRWYTRCCHTPIGNTLPAAKMSFIGLIHTFMDQSALDHDFGTAIALVNTRTALGDPKPRQRGVVGAVLRFARLVLAARLSGRYKQSPLFTATGAPLVTPRILTAAELQSLKRAASGSDCGSQ